MLIAYNNSSQRAVLPLSGFTFSVLCTVLESIYTKCKYDGNNLGLLCWKLFVVIKGSLSNADNLIWYGYAQKQNIEYHQ